MGPRCGCRAASPLYLLTHTSSPKGSLWGRLGRCLPPEDVSQMNALRRVGLWGGKGGSSGRKFRHHRAVGVVGLGGHPDSDHTAGGTQTGLPLGLTPLCTWPDMCVGGIFSGMGEGNPRWEGWCSPQEGQ